MNTYEVTIHAGSHEAPDDCDEDPEIVCYSEDISADKFDVGVFGTRFFIGEEMVAFFSDRLLVSVAKYWEEPSATEG